MIPCGEMRKNVAERQAVLDISVEVSAKKQGDQEARKIVCSLISREERHKIYHSGKIIS